MAMPCSSAAATTSSSRTVSAYLSTGAYGTSSVGNLELAHYPDELYVPPPVKKDIMAGPKPLGKVHEASFLPPAAARSSVP